MARFTSILDRLGGGNSNVVSRLVEGRKVPMGSGLPLEVIVERLAVNKAHKKTRSQKQNGKEHKKKKTLIQKQNGKEHKKLEEPFNERYTDWFKKAKKINIEGEGIHFNRKKE